MDLIRKTFLLEDKMLEKIEILRKQNTHLTQVDVIRAAVNLYWKDTFKYGTDPLLNSGSAIGGGNTVEAKAMSKVQRKLAEKKAEQDLKDAPKIKICLDELCGEIVTNPQGAKMCRWNTYSPDTTESQMVQISQVGKYLVENQFIPDKETVLKQRPELKKIFK